jgi:N6-adenosine-specific RNA methylase IME4
MSKFGTAIIDPPWPYEKSSRHERLTGYSDKEYRHLGIDDLQSLKINGLADYVFLWTTGPFIESAYKLLRDWGLEPITFLGWVKTAEIIQGNEPAFKPNYGVGYWFRGCIEPIILAKKPGVPSIRTNFVGILSPNSRHSRKPHTLHEVVETCFPGPYLEIFARELRLGWRCLGNEAPWGGDDIRVSLERLHL